MHRFLQRFSPLAATTGILVACSSSSSGPSTPSGSPDAASDGETSSTDGSIIEASADGSVAAASDGSPSLADGGVDATPGDAAIEAAVDSGGQADAGDASTVAQDGGPCPDFLGALVGMWSDCGCQWTFASGGAGTYSCTDGESGTFSATSTGQLAGGGVGPGGTGTVTASGTLTGSPCSGSLEWSYTFKQNQEAPMSASCLVTRTN
jgi:hypothetical protein